VIKPTPCAMPHCCKDCSIEMVITREQMERDAGGSSWSDVCARGPNFVPLLYIIPAAVICFICAVPIALLNLPAYHNYCCNCEKERGWKHYNQKGCVQCKDRAAAKAAVAKDAAEKLGRREVATNLDGFLRDMCEIHDQERRDVVDAFMDPRYMVSSTPKFFALGEKDLDTIVASLSLGTRRLIKSAWLEMGLHGGAAGG